MTNDAWLFNVLALCDEKRKFLYEVIDGFGDKLSVDEIGYWIVYNIIGVAKAYQLTVSGKTYDEVIENIESASRKRKEKINAI